MYITGANREREHEVEREIKLPSFLTTYLPFIALGLYQHFLSKH